MAYKIFLVAGHIPVEFFSTSKVALRCYRIIFKGQLNNF